jgi:outer membrane protein
MRKIILVSLISIKTLFGDIIGGEINLGVYNHSPSGTAQNGEDSVDIENDLNWDKENDIFLKAYLEHPIPLIPNIMVGYSRFIHDGSGSISKDFNWGGVEFFSISDNVESSLELDIYDLAVYYEILDNWLNFDIGINLKYFNGDIDIDSNLKSKHTNIEFIIPTIYAKARFDVPTTDFSIQLEGNAISYDDNRYYDLELGARYTFMLGFGAEIGYKSMKLKIDDIDDISMDADFNGVYGKLIWDF